MKLRQEQLTFAREYRKLTQTALASKISGLSQSNLSKFEKGLDTISDDLVKKIMDYLNFPHSFLNKKLYNESDTAHFRKRATIRKKDILEIENSYKLIGYLIDEMSESLIWPEFNLRTYDLEDGFTPMSVAINSRKLLGLTPNEPVQDICKLLESNGVFIVELNSIEKFDGVSFVSDKGHAVIVINENFSNDRKRFTIAHELGHLLMHSINNPAIPDYRMKELENEANNFASEFLMPEKAIKNSLYNLKLGKLASLKRYWLTSMASIIRRAKDLGGIDYDTYRYLYIEFSRKGLRRDEGFDVYIDSPELFRKGYQMFKQELDYSNSEMADAFSLPIDVIEKYCNTERGNAKLRVLI